MDGYKYSKSRQQFELKKNDMVFSISNTCIDRNPEFIIEFVLKIRSNRVEDISSKFTHDNPDSFKHSASFIVPFAYFMQKRTEFTIKKKDDVINKIIDFFSSL